ncbi:MAG: hypothetical protein IAF58_14760 [Leptolyngbya sp.]|nr:hypothetical protein [Candidatus Melainabacteria bacterium]
MESVDTFDLLEFQQKARDLCCPKKLFQLWEDVCRRYDGREIGEYELEEMKEVIWPSLRALASIRNSVNDEPVAIEETPKRKSA